MQFNLSDLFQCITVMKNDAEDTKQKAFKLASNLQRFMSLCDDYNQDVDDVISEEFEDLYSYFEREPSLCVGNSLITIKAQRILANLTDTVGLNIKFYRGVDKVGSIYCRYGYVDHHSQHVNGVFKMAVDDVSNETAYNIDYVNPLNVVFGSTVLGSDNFNIAGLISNLKTTIQVQSLFQDIGQIISSKMSYQGLLTKWSGITDLTGSTKSIFEKFVSNVPEQKTSMLQYLLGNYSKAMSTTANDDGVITWSSTDDTVKFCFSTVFEVVGSVISTVVQSVCTIIGGVFYAIGSVASLLTSALGRLLSTATNPLLDIDEDKPLAVPIPFAQISDDTADIGPFADLTGYDSCSMHGPMFCSRLWTDAVTTHRCLELFLKPYLTASDIHDSDINREGLSAFSGISSLVSICLHAKSLRSQYGRPDLACAPQESALEGGQCMIIAANIFILMRAMYQSSYNIPAYPETTAACWAAMTSSSSTPEEKFSGAIGLCYKAWELLADDSIYEKVLKNTTANNEELMALHYNWYDIFNVTIPLIRESWTGIQTNIPGYWPDFRVLNADPNALFEDYYLTVDNYAYPCTTYGIYIPKNTAKGVIAGLIATVALTAVVAVGAALAVINIKKSITKLQIKKSTQTAAAYDKYKMAVAGLDYNDPTGSTLHEYTDDEKEALLNNYYKSARRYNRMSALWGGSTWSMVNGWDDGAPDPVSVPESTSLSSNLLPDISGFVEENGDAAGIQELKSLIR